MTPQTKPPHPRGGGTELPVLLPIMARAVDPSAALMLAYFDPRVSDDEFAAMAREIHGDIDDQI